MKNKFNLKRYFTVCLLVLSVFLSGCNILFVRSDKLYFITETTAVTSPTSIQIKVDSYDILMNGTLLYYDYVSSTGLYTVRERDHQKLINYLYVFDSEGSRLLFTSENSYTEGYINVSEDVIYFKEYNTELKQVTLYRTNLNATTKERYSETFTEASLVWHATKTSFYYINSNNSLVRVTHGVEVEEHAFDDVGVAIKKIAYMPSINCMFLTIVGSQKSTILYRLDLASGEISAIDGNVGDFVCSDNSGMVAYTKTTAGRDQLYLYNTKTYLRTYLTTSDIDKISLSPNGNYVVFATKIATDSPSQSIWIINSKGDTPTQLTANTTLQGSIFFTGISSIMFTQVETPSNSEDPVYTVRDLTYSFDYNQTIQLEKNGIK